MSHFSLKCSKFDFGWSSAPDPAGRAYSAPPDPLAGFQGLTSKGGEGREGEMEEKEKTGGEDRKWAGRGLRPPTIY